MKLTEHAKIRGQQRGISRDEMELITNHGNPVEVNGNAIAYEIDGKTKDYIISRCKRTIQLVERLTGTRVLLSKEETVITTYHVNR